MVHVVIVNGRPGSGKTTFEMYCMEYLSKDMNMRTHILSTIDPIKEIYRQLGWNGSKTDDDRNALHTLKQMWIRKCNGALKYVIKNVLDIADTNPFKHATIFIDIREQEEIVKTVNALNNLSGIYDISTYTLLLSSDKDHRRGITSSNIGNDGDDLVECGGYECTVENDGTLEQLEEMAIRFIDDIVYGRTK